MRVLRREAALDRAGVRPARAPRLDGRAGTERGARLRRGEPLGRRRARDERPAPERRPPERRQPDLTRPPRGRADRLRREPRAPRRRRRRRAGLDRGVQGGLPGGRDHPAGQAGGRRRDREGRLHADSGPDPLEARDGGRLPRSDRRERHRRATRHGAGRPPRARHDPRDDGGAARVHGAAHPGRARRARARRLRGRGLRRHGRLHRRDRPPEGAGRARRAGRPLRHDRLRPATACPGQLDLRDVVLGLRVRPQVPDRPGSARQRRLLPARQPARAGRERHELLLARPGRRRLGDPRAADRGDRPRAAAGLPRAAAGGDEGDDVPGGLRLPRRRRREVHVLLRHVRGWLRRPVCERRSRCRPVTQPEHRERADRGDRAQLPGPHQPALAGGGLRRAGPLPGRPRAAQGLSLRPPHHFHRARRPRQGGTVGRLRRPRRADRRVRARPRRCRDAAVVEDDARPRPR